MLLVLAAARFYQHATGNAPGATHCWRLLRLRAQGLKSGADIEVDVHISHFDVHIGNLLCGVIAMESAVVGQEG